jgi:hypothetical protein
MSRWFRMYDELLDDPKVQRLSGDDFKGWVNLLALASRHNGKLPAIADIAFALRETEDAVSTLLGRLLNGGLIESRSGGADGMHYAPYRWAERQYKSDTSTDRVKRFRERSKPVAETAPDTDTETEDSVAKATGGKPPADPVKDLFDLGVALLTATGCSEKQARSLIGKWRKAKGDAEVLQALIDCRARSIANPVEWLEARFKSGRWTSKSGYEYRGTDEQVLREAEKRHDMDTYWSVHRVLREKKAAA